MEIKEAVQTVIKALNSDPQYRYSWQANIAMAFKDCAVKAGSKNDPETDHMIANAGAEYFLRLFCYIGEPEKEEPGAFSLARLVTESVEAAR